MRQKLYLQVKSLQMQFKHLFVLEQRQSLVNKHYYEQLQ